MKKTSILKHKITRSFNNADNLIVSKSKAYEGYFGYQSLDELIKDTVKCYKSLYGDSLRHWRYI